MKFRALFTRIRYEPIQQFEGVEMPEQEDRTKARERAPADWRAREPAPGAGRAAASASASSVAPSSPVSRGRRGWAARQRAAVSSASPAAR
jgi:hypothetical protein